MTHTLSTIGIMGGIGSGKSKVAGILRELGAKIIDADRLVHEILKRQEVKRVLTRMWGECLLTAGEIDRRKLAEIVFPGREKSSKKNLRRLEKILHPLVRGEIEKRLKEAFAEKTQAAVIDAPLLWERGLYKKCNILIFVDTPLSIRQVRVARDRGWTPQQLSAREKFQGNLEEKRRAAGYVVFNGESEEATREQVRNLWKTLS